MAHTRRDPHDTVRDAVKVQMALRGESKEDLARVLDVNYETARRRLSSAGRGTRWSWGEVLVLAEHYDQPISYFIDGPEAGWVRTAPSSALLAA